MLDLLNVFMNKFPDYHPDEDGIEKEVNLLRAEFLIKDSQIRMVPANDLTISNIKKQGIDPFEETFKHIRNEVIWFQESFKEYYNGDVMSTTIGQSIDLKTVYRNLFKRVIRARKLKCVLSPYFTETKSYNAKSDKYYSNAKCYYIDEFGISKRMVSKNIGTYGEEIEGYVSRLMKMNGYSVVATPEGRMRLNPDLIVAKDGVQYLVNVSLKSKDHFFSLLFTLELWSRYKAEYYNV